jgi:hypothetical protein
MSILFAGELPNADSSRGHTKILSRGCAVGSGETAVVIHGENRDDAILSQRYQA